MTVRCVQYGRSWWMAYDDKGKFLASGKTKRDALTKVEDTE